MKKEFPWVSESVVLQLDAKDLPKLIPTRFRLKGRVATGGITGTSILYDTSTATAKVIEPDQPTYDKEPDIKYTHQSTAPAFGQSVTYQQRLDAYEAKVDKANATLFANMTQSIVNEHKNHKLPAIL